MIMQEIAMLQFADADSGEEDLAIIRAGANLVALSLSKKMDGDVEVFLQYQDCIAIIKALQQALSTIE